MRLTRYWIAGLPLVTINLALAVKQPRYAGAAVVRNLHPRHTDLRRFEFTQPEMGTLFRIVLYAPDAATATRASRAVFDRVRELDNIMSDYNPGSELMLLCQRAAGPPIKISEDLFRVMAAAQDWAKRSDGAFDITVGPVVRLWRRARRQHELPESQRLAHVLELVGYDKLLLDSKAHTAQLLKPGMLLDLGGIGKGYAADEALRTLKRFEIRSALIVAGGDIAVGDPPPGKEGWRIGIAAPQSRETAHDQSRVQNLKSEIQNRDFQRRYVYIHNAGISTSGDTEQQVEIGGTRYSHIVNPKTGLALTGRSSVTVIAPDDTTADAMATAISVLGPKRGLELVDSTPGTAALISVVSEGGVQSFESNFPAMTSMASKRKD